MTRNDVLALSAPDEEGVTVAKRTDESGAGLGTRKVCMRTVLDQRDDHEIPITNAASPSLARTL